MRTSQALFQDPDLVERILHFVQDGRVRASAAAISRTFCTAAQRPTCWLAGLQATPPFERLAAVRAVLQLALHASVPPGPQAPSNRAHVAGAVLQFAARPDSTGSRTSPDAPGILVRLVAEDPDRRVRQAALVACALLCRNITALEHLAAQPPLSPFPVGDAASGCEELLVAQRWTRDTDGRFHSLIERSARSRTGHNISPLPCPNPGLASLVYALEQHAIALRNPLKAVEDTHGTAQEREYEEAARLASSTAQAEAQRHAIVAVADRQIVRMLALQGVQLALAFQALRLADGWGYRRVEVLVRVVADSSGMECAAVLRLMLAHGAVSVRDAIVYGADVAGIAHQDDWLGRQQRQDVLVRFLLNEEGAGLRVDLVLREFADMCDPIWGHYRISCDSRDVLRAMSRSSGAGLPPEELARGLADRDGAGLGAVQVARALGAATGAGISPAGLAQALLSEHGTALSAEEVARAMCVGANLSSMEVARALWEGTELEVVPLVQALMSEQGAGAGVEHTAQALLHEDGAFLTAEAAMHGLTHTQGANLPPETAARAIAQVNVSSIGIKDLARALVCQEGAHLSPAVAAHALVVENGVRTSTEQAAWALGVADGGALPLEEVLWALIGPNGPGLTLEEAVAALVSKNGLWCGLEEVAQTLARDCRMQLGVAEVARVLMSEAGGGFSAEEVECALLCAHGGDFKEEDMLETLAASCGGLERPSKVARL
ncbi:hypothetical protein CYMTET_34292 [Cymbomonas tetramitiformis]|uniref:Uncharacterized protein n=1 Tax=Cymbomonas tetramitiformis TaxID=36881 RepID=A0AAE0FBW3_9CHLO|nr:hypothetical protein CYMTET_34292 [Cymbomonas tetramitiformis]